MICVEHALRQCVREHRVQELSCPRLTLHDQVDGQWLERRRQLRVLGDDDVSELRIVAATECSEHPRGERRRSGRENPWQRVEKRTVPKRD